MKYLIAGLGNIGAEYDHTRHNIGFDVLDALSTGIEGLRFETGRKAMVAQMKHRGRSLILLKPTTYMNLSGEAIQHWLQQEKIQSQNLLVITDDLALPFSSQTFNNIGEAVMTGATTFGFQSQGSEG